jgi:hypothetical protein
MIFLVLYDQRGQCQRVATATTRAIAAQFLAAGFVEVDEAEYRRCAELVSTATLDDLVTIGIAASLLSNILSNTRVARQFYEPNRNALSRIQSALDTEMQSVTQEYLSGNISIDQWQRRMQDNINAGNTASRVVAVNGQGNLTADDIRAIERANETQARFLNRFRREIEADGRTLTDNQILARARQYSRSNTPVFESGYSSRVLGITLPYQPSVLTCCGIYCRCHWQIVQVGANDFDCLWQLGSAEHCKTCINRNRVLKPLQVRNGIIQTFNPSGLEDTPYSC